MKALSLWQPWASLWCSEDKEHETRDWILHHRGWLLVHATKKLVSDCGEELDGIAIDNFGPHWRTELPRGAIIGAVNVVDVRATSVILKAWGEPIATRHYVDYLCGDYSPGRFGFLRKEFKRFATPIPYRGQQGPFDVPWEIVREAMT